MTPPGDPIIRAATAADLPALGRLGEILVGAHHDFDPDRFIPATPRTAQGYASFLSSQLSAPGVLLLVAEQGGQVVGYAYAGIEGFDYMSLRGPAGVLHDIVVHPGRRGAGVGRALLEAVVAALRERGVPQVVLSTAERNQRAQRLFEGMGFRRTMIEMTLALTDED